MNDLEIVVATQEYIKSHHNDSDFSIESICHAIGYSRPVISSALNGNDDNITDKMLRSINNKFPSLFDIDYLLTGEGQLLKVEEHVA